MMESRTTPHAVRIRNADRPLQQPRLFQPCRTGHLAIAVQAEPSGVDVVGVLLSARKNHGDAGSHRAIAHLQRAVSANQRGCTDLDSRNIRDRIELPRRPVERHAKIAGAYRICICMIFAQRLAHAPPESCAQQKEAIRFCLCITKI